MKSIDVRILVKNSHFINDIIPFIRKNSSLEHHLVVLMICKFTKEAVEIQPI